MNLRPAAVAGAFYPAPARQLAEQIDHYLAAARVDSSGEGGVPKALVCPHAGIVYSGKTAGAAYALLTPARRKIRRVAIFGPTHRVGIRGLALPTVDGMATPLGTVPIDAAGRELALRLPKVFASDAPHVAEHSLEVQLPFLQRVLDDFAVLPFAVGDATPREVAEVIEACWGGNDTLIVISSDLSHFHPYREACALDRASVDAVLALAGPLDHGQACGATPLNGLLEVARRRRLVPTLLDLCNSGDTAGDKARVVGYAALRFDEAPSPGAAVTDSGAATAGAPEKSAGSGHAARFADAGRAADAAPSANSAANSAASDPTAPDALGAALLALAREAISRQLAGESGVAPKNSPAALPELDRPGATFVTLTRRGELRGCIGSLEARRPLRQDVVANAGAAAFRDPRFSPVTADEWPALRVEVSLLTPPEALPVADEDELRRRLRPGIDGVIFSVGDRRATFLPQVWEQLPKVADFLAQLKRKAGLPADFWSPEVTIQRYEVRKWKER